MGGVTAPVLARRMPASPRASSVSPARGGLLQRQCACGGAGRAGECQECRAAGAAVQRLAAGPGGAHLAPPTVHEVLRSPGQPLDPATRAFMEPRFGHDFGRVRVHSDAHAAESARAVNALAFTVGRHVVFAAGQYAPHTSTGRHLLAHELTHVAQQPSGAAGSEGQLTVGPSHDSFEREADQMAGQVAAAGEQSQSGRPVDAPVNAVRQRLVQRQEGGAAAAGSEVVYLCSKPLETSPVGTHAFFRVGGSGPGNPTYSLEPVNQPLFDPDDFDQEHGWKSGCWQGVPMRDYPEDFNAEGNCQATAIARSCIESEFASYPIGLYCTLGPNSNTFVGEVARNCGLSDPDPPGWNPGIDDDPPAPDTYAPSPNFTLVAGCSEKLCGRGA